MVNTGDRDGGWARRAACLLLVLLLWGCGPGGQAPPPSERATMEAVEAAGVSADEYAVYSAVIVERWPADKLIVVKDETATTEHIEPGGVKRNPRMRGLDSGVFDRFLARNQHAYPLADRFAIPHRRVFFSGREFEELFRRTRDLQTAYKEFHARHPGTPGWLHLSRVAFNERRTQALVYVANYVHGMNATGRLVYLTREQDGWKVREQSQVWMA
jgi:hypothetical protein